MQLSSHQVDIWISHLKEMEPNSLKRLSSYLSVEEVERMERFIRLNDRKRFLAASGLLRVLLANYLDQDPEKLFFKRTKHGKPYLANTPIHFNLSHAGDYIIWAFSLQKVGVDIEYTKREVDVLGLTKRFFSEREYRFLKELSDSDRQLAFYRCWTRKEAFIKALGKGLSYPLDNFVIDCHQKITTNGLLSLEGDEKKAMRWLLTPLDVPKNYVAALAIEELEAKVNYYKNWKSFLK